MRSPASARTLEEPDLLDGRNGAGEGRYAARGARDAALDEARVQLRHADADAVARRAPLHRAPEHLHAAHLPPAQCTRANQYPHMSWDCLQPHMWRTHAESVLALCLANLRVLS